MSITSVDQAFAAAAADNPGVQTRHFAKNLGATLNTTDPPVNLMPYGPSPAARNPDATKAATAITNALTTGIIGFANPAVGKQLQLQSLLGRLISTTVALGDAATLVVVDRLLEYGGFVGNAAVNQNPTNPVGLPRYQDAIDVQMSAVVSVASLGGAGPNLDVTYDDEASVSHVVTVPVRTDGTVVGRIVTGTEYFIPLPAGRGVKRITQVKLSASTGAAGQYAIFLFKVLGVLPLNRSYSRETLTFGLQRILPRLYDGAALDFFLVNASTTAFAAAGVSGILHALEG